VRRTIGMVFQRPNPFPKSIYDNVAWGLKVLGMKDNISERVERALTQAARVADMTAFFSISRGEEGERWGELVEYDQTEKIFTAPSDKRTEDYVTGRFG